MVENGSNNQSAIYEKLSGVNHHVFPQLQLTRHLSVPPVSPPFASFCPLPLSPLTPLSQLLDRPAVSVPVPIRLHLPSRQLPLSPLTALQLLPSAPIRRSSYRSQLPPAVSATPLRSHSPFQLLLSAPTSCFSYPSQLSSAVSATAPSPHLLTQLSAPTLSSHPPFQLPLIALIRVATTALSSHPPFQLSLSALLRFGSPSRLHSAMPLRCRSSTDPFACRMALTTTITEPFVIHSACRAAFSEAALSMQQMARSGRRLSALNYRSGRSAPEFRRRPERRLSLTQDRSAPVATHGSLQRTLPTVAARRDRTARARATETERH